MTAFTLLVIAFAFVFLLLCLVTYKLYKFSIIILKLENEIEESLTILESHYDSIAEVLTKEIFFDSVEVRQVISDIKSSHDAILTVSEKLTSSFRYENEKNS